MRRRTRTAVTAAALVTAAAALTGPIAASGDVGPHSTWYEQHLRPRAASNDVSIVIRRDKHLAYVSVTNFCLGIGTYTNPDGTKTSYPNTATLPAIRVGRKATLTFHGKGTVYSSGNPKKVPSSFAAQKGRRQYSGHASFPGTKCGTIRFVAKLGGSTK